MTQNKIEEIERQIAICVGLILFLFVLMVITVQYNGFWSGVLFGVSIIGTIHTSNLIPKKERKLKKLKKKKNESEKIS